MPRSIPFDEQETVILITPSQISKTAEVYTCMPSWLNKLRKQAKNRPDCVRIKRDLGDSLFAEVDRSCVKITPKRQLSGEQKEAAVARIMKLREAKQK